MWGTATKRNRRFRAHHAWGESCLSPWHEGHQKPDIHGGEWGALQRRRSFHGFALPVSVVHQHRLRITSLLHQRQGLGGVNVEPDYFTISLQSSVGTLGGHSESVCIGRNICATYANHVITIRNHICKLAGLSVNCPNFKSRDQIPQSLTYIWPVAESNVPN